MADSFGRTIGTVLVEYYLPIDNIGEIRFFKYLFQLASILIFNCNIFLIKTSKMVNFSKHHFIFFFLLLVTEKNFLSSQEAKFY